MMDDIKKIFIEEAKDLVADLEGHLITLEEGGVSSEIIAGIFRVMHSLKGGSSMFGFAKLDELTHNLENIYNSVRNNEETLTQEIIDITFESVDIIKELLSPNIDELAIENTDILIVKLKEVINTQVSLENLSNLEEVEENTEVKTYYVLFKPNADIMNNGTNPLYVIDELVELSKSNYVIARTSDIPSLENYNSQICYIWWEIILVTAKPKAEIESVFMFVEDNAEIKIEEVYNENIFNFSGFKELIENIESENSTLNFDEILQKLQTSKEEVKFSSNEISNSVDENKRNLIKKIEEAKNESNTILKKNEYANIKVSSVKLDELMNMVSELVTTQARLQMLSENSESVELALITEDITKITRRLRDNAFSIILIPIESILIKFRRLVRDLSNNLDKSIKFITEGTDTELDKTIIETINEPILHLIRNAIDHGIESKEERLKLGKPEQGTISLKSFCSGSNVYIQISDDGSGINIDAIKKKAIEKNIIEKDSKISEKEIIDLIWMPGFTTVSVVSGVSGRGVGMDVVSKKISEVRGEIEIETKRNIGTTFTLKLPLTLSIIDGLLVKVQDTKYIIQLSVISKIHKINHNQLTESFNNFIVIDDEQIPYIYLRDYFTYNKNVDDEHVIVIESEDKKIGIVVDDVLGEYQAVLKPLGHHYRSVEIFSGGTILGDGTVALVLDTNKIVRNNK